MTVRLPSTCEADARGRSAVTRAETDVRGLAHKLAAAIFPEDEAHLTRLLSDARDRVDLEQVRLEQHRAACTECTRSSFRPRLTDDQKSDLVALVRDGLPWDEIAEAFGVSRSVVLYYAKRVGIDRERDSTPAAPGEPNEPAPLFQFPSWMADGLCAQTDPEMFFPEKGGSTREAKSVCVACPVAAECLDYALEHNERFGIWGGLSERERRSLTNTTPAA